MRRVRKTIEMLEVGYNEISVILGESDYDFWHFISPQDVNFFPIDKNGNSINGKLSVGTVIEFDAPDTKTRRLYNVEIVVNE
ncbi:hypothetical protein [Francisella hispaniensis]|uniref:Uncharacterized protein n=1 Tax=Francisella hispaniensis TaxID=622488 RepID=F4BFQ4_9GAMM|nr:hypothetical protein [Francisella hispaniensis]AEE26298.1 hypothetical protein FN3523_0995 [Francisella hispaniensis]